MRIAQGVLDRVAEAVERQMALWRVPGVALALVDESGPVLCRGFGRRALGPDLPVTEHTLFAIGSCTKAFTTAAIGLLVDEGLLDWEAPVRRVMPDFELSDPVASREITLTDMCCHRSGLPAHDLVWYNATLSQAELVRRIRYLEPSRPFRAAYQYSNLMYMAAGQAVERVAGVPWAELVTDRILRPLGMASSRAAAGAIEDGADAALPYTRQGDGWVETARYASREGRPSGSVHSSAEDLGRWLQFQTAAGGSDAPALLSARQLQTIRTPQIVPEPVAPVPETVLAAYALGWSVASYRGRLRLGHSGGVRGYSAMLSFMPGERLGVAIGTNMDGHALGPALQNEIYDLVLGGEGRDWGRIFQDLAQGAFVLVNDAAAPRVPGTTPSHALRAYAGTYRHPAYGDVDVESRDDALAMRFHGLEWSVRHRHYDQFEVEGEVAHTVAAFDTELDGSIGAVRLRLEPDRRVRPIEFRRTQG